MSNAKRSEVACPYCDERHRDLEEYFEPADEDVPVDCGACGNRFTLSRRVSVEYAVHKRFPKR